jgi:hypothetical protein
MRTRRGTSNRRETESWAERARTALGEVEGAVQDMLRPLPERELGPAVHRRLLTEGLSSLHVLLDGSEGPRGP